MAASALLLETIKCFDGLPLYLDYHQKRIDYSRDQLGYDTPLILRLDPPRHGLYRCRVLYCDTVEKIEYLPYQEKDIRHFKLIHSNIDYTLKYADREDINALLTQKGSADEIIIVKDGLITDTSIANICFYDGAQWLTPRVPLLKGTTRQRFLDQGKLIEADISYTQIDTFEKIGLLNAMVGFKVVENAIIS